MEKICHRLAVAVFDLKDDPIAPFKDHSELLESALGNPKQTFGGKELYPELADKAAILYYSLNKNHPFRNGNKRISAASLVVFLFINGQWLDVSQNELFEKTLFVAKSEASQNSEVITDITRWIKGHLISAADLNKKQSPSLIALLLNNILRWITKK
jgi:death-on-curing protein